MSTATMGENHLLPRDIVISMAAWYTTRSVMTFAALVLSFWTVTSGPCIRRMILYFSDMHSRVEGRRS